MTMYSPSKYNYIYKKEDKLFVINTLSGLTSFGYVEGEEVCLAERLLSGDDHAVETFKETTLCRKLIANGFLLQDPTQEFYAVKMQNIRKIAESILHLIIIPTEKCNFACIYCYQRNKTRTLNGCMQEAIVKFVSRNISKYRGLHISWFGGEPTEAMDIIENISKKLLEICHMSKRSYKADITTNGYNLNLEYFKKLYKLKVLFYQITVDGLKQDHDQYRYTHEGKGTYDTIISNLTAIKNYTGAKLASFLLRSNLTKKSLNTLHECIDLYHGIFADDKRFYFAPYAVNNWGGNDVDKIKEDIFTADDYRYLYETLKTGKYMQYEFLFNFSQDGRDICYASQLNCYVIGVDLAIHKCTLMLESEANNIGYLDQQGCMHIDEAKHAIWVVGGSNEPVCANCFYFPRCYGSRCMNKSRNHTCGNNFKCAEPIDKLYFKEQLALLEKTDKCRNLLR